MLHRYHPRPSDVASALTAAVVLLCAAPSVGSPDAGVAPAAVGGTPDGAMPPPFGDPITAREREALRARLRPLTVVVRRRGGEPPGMWAPGDGVEVHGWWAAEKRVVTAATAVEGWPRSRRDRLEVELADGRRFGAAVGLTESALGLVVLDVPRLPAPASPAPAGGPDAVVAPGRPLYAADATGLLHRVVVDRRAVGQLAYYHRLSGRLSLGTPLFDSTGRAVSLIGRDGPEPTVGLALPAKALRALLERHDWIP